jgi:hypothetical protein
VWLDGRYDAGDGCCVWRLLSTSLYLSLPRSICLMSLAGSRRLCQPLPVYQPLPV